MGLFKSLGNFLFGSSPKMKQRSRLSEEQLPLYNQMLAAIAGPGAGGAFGSAADYYRQLLSPDSQTAQAMFSPEMRKFQEETIPGLAEQFAGMGSGNLSSSGFRNAAVNAGADLQERLGAIRAQLQQQGAMGLMGLGQMGVSPQYTENYATAGQPGFFASMAPGVGAGIGMGLGAPAGAAFSSALQNLFNRKGNITPGTTSPYGGSLARGAQAGITASMR